MAYRFVFTRNAKKDIQKLPSKLKKRLAQKLLIIADGPLQFSKKLISPKLGTYRYRFGNYRLIFDIDHDNEKVIVLKFHHRKDVYKR